MHKFIENMRAMMRKSPIITSLLMLVVYFVTVNLVGEVMIRLPEGTIVYYIQEFAFMGTAFLFLALFGYTWTFKRGKFFKTTGALAYMYVTQVLLMVSVIYEAITAPEGPWKAPLMIIVGVISLFQIGFCEEVIFRGVIVNALVGKYGKDAKGIWFTVLISGLLFGSAHLSNYFFGVTLEATIVQAISASAIGIYFAAAYLRGRSLWSMIVLHTIIDFNSLFTSSFMEVSTAIDNINALDLSSLLLVPFEILLVAYLLRKSKMQEILEDVKSEKEYALNQDA